MRLPQPTIVNPIRQLSPSVYEVLLRCRARGAWAAHGDRSLVPVLPKALLGTCFHAVVEDAHNGNLSGLDDETALTAARSAFDRRGATLYSQGHPLLRAKFSSPEKLPYYNLYRERAALEATGCAARIEGTGPAPAREVETTPAAATLAEKRLVSSDGLIVGRPDFVDLAAGEVVDYKTGLGPQDGLTEMSDAEVRQLRLYVHLAIENGMRISRAVIARADGRRASIDVTPEQAAREGLQARELLAEYNSRAGEQFDLAAQPSPESCQFCPCIPFCNAFWRAASPDWAERCGIHIEGRVDGSEASTVQGLTLVTLRVDGRRGTVPAGETFVEQVPEAWMTADGSERPRTGDTARIVYGRMVTEAPPHVIRVDRVATSVWTVI